MLTWMHTELTCLNHTCYWIFVFLCLCVCKSHTADCCCCRCADSYVFHECFVVALSASIINVTKGRLKNAPQQLRSNDDDLLERSSLCLSYIMWKNVFKSSSKVNVGLQQPKVSHIEWRASQGFRLLGMDSVLSVSTDGVHVLSSGGGTVTQNVSLSY